jgi:hypothetical protein
MTQALYAHMNNKTIKKKENKLIEDITSSQMALEVTVCLLTAIFPLQKTSMYSQLLILARG